MIKFTTIIRPERKSIFQIHINIPRKYLSNKRNQEYQQYHNFSDTKPIDYKIIYVDKYLNSLFSLLALKYLMTYTLVDAIDVLLL